MTGGKTTVLLVGCPELASAARSEGYDVHIVEYFWGCSDPVQPVWRVAVVNIDVGGGTGLSVAERLLERRVVPIILYGRAERFRVEPRFFGIEWRRGQVPGALARMLETCVRLSNALRLDAWTTEHRVRTSMIVRVDSTTS